MGTVRSTVFREFYERPRISDRQHLIRTTGCHLACRSELARVTSSRLFGGAIAQPKAKYGIYGTH